MVKQPTEATTVRRVKTISGGMTVRNSVIGVSVRYHVGKDRCEAKVRYWFRLKIFRKTIIMSASTGWQGCEDGFAIALALADKFEAEEIQLCDPEGHLSESIIEDVRQKVVEAESGK